MHTTTVSRVSDPPVVLDWLRTLVSIAFVVTVPLLVIGTSLRSLVQATDPFAVIGAARHTIRDDEIPF